MTRYWASLALLASSFLSCGSPERELEVPARGSSLEGGVAAYEPAHDSVTIWARRSSAGTLAFELVGPEGISMNREVNVNDSTDFTGAARFANLTPGTSYQYQVRASGDGKAGAPVKGRFQTPPLAGEALPVRFAWTGDLSGQNVCRDAERGFPIVGHIIATEPQFFVALGDMIYADQSCEAVGRYGNAQVAGGFGPAETIESFWAHWRYNRQDKALQRLFAAAPQYALWDDHEVVDDFGPTSGTTLIPMGLRAFLDYNPIAQRGRPLYRSVRWGKHVELLILDNRSFRDANDALDDGKRAKTMLGAKQLAWLLSRLRNSDATWKIIASSVPLSIPTGADPPEVARDGWADYGSGQGFERELRSILDEAAVAAANMVWITTDVHFGSVFQYEPTPGYTFHELVVGPMNAGMFPKQEFDDSFKPKRLFFHGPDDPEALTYAEALAYMTFGTASVDASGKLTLRIIDANGKKIFELGLTPR